MAEFAMTIPLLVLVLFAIVQFGIVFANYIEVTAASREGARRAAVSRTTTTGVADAITAARNAAWIVDPTDLAVTVTPPQPWDSGQEIEVTVSYPYSIGVPGLATQTGTLRSTVIARVE